MHCTVTELLKGLTSNFNELKTLLRNYTQYLESNFKHIYIGYHEFS